VLQLVFPCVAISPLVSSLMQRRTVCFGMPAFFSSLRSKFAQVTDSCPLIRWTVCLIRYTLCFSHIPVIFPAPAALPGMPGLPALSQAAAAAGGQLLGQGLPGMPGAMNPLAGAMGMGPMGMPGMPGLPGAMQGMGLGPMGQMQGEWTRYLICYVVILMREG
jgi:hypothetical protein